MEKEIISEMKKYLAPQLIIGGIVFIAGIIMLLVFILLKPLFGVKPFDGFDTIIGLTFFLSFGASVTGVIEKFKLNKQIKAFKESGQLNRVLNDFQFAQPMYNGGIKLGKEYIFGNKCTAIVRYSDIAKIYEYVHTTNSVKDQRILMAELKNGRCIKLCCLKVYKNTKADEQAVIEVILRNNPLIELGEKESC